MSLFANNPELLAAFREGRRDALERVYRTYARPVDRALRAMARASGNNALTQASAIADLLQEVFVRAFSQAARRGYDGERDFGPYLTTIAHNCFVDALRATGREVLKGPEDLTLALDVAGPEPDGWCDPRALAVLSRYVRDLSAPLRAVYEQRFVLGVSQQEASSALGLSRRAIRTGEGRLRRGLRKALVRAGISLRELGDAEPEDLSARIPVPAVVAHKGPS
jgi:RNA polymerase sigma factor (sigma-70 family)